MEKKFLVQKVYDDGEVYVELMTEYQLVKFVNFLDLDDTIVDYAVYDVSEFKKMEKLYYCGWQPNCLIEFMNADLEVVVHGYGDDH